MNPNTFKDQMVTNDDLLITNKVEQASPHGRLFQVLGMQNGRRVVKEIACNTVVVGGAITALENLIGETANWKPKTINEIRSIPKTVTGTPTLCLFGAGTGGAGLEFGSVIAPDIKQDDVKAGIPIRYTEAVTGDDADKYYMKKLNEDGTTYSYFLKEFDTTPIIKTCWKNSIDPNEDGTEVTSDISGSTSTDGIETFTEFNIALNLNDFREYFEAQGQLAVARYNTFGFYTGIKADDDSEYGDVRLYSVITFNNRDLSIPSTATFIYRVYSLI